jgi:hypothetical protein
MSTTITSPPLDSQFRDGPILPTIRQIPNASWPTVEGKLPVRRPGLAVQPILNKVYFTKKVALQTLKRYDHSRCVDVVEQIWEIPFSVDVNEPVTELVQKIQAVMTAKGIYKHWDINMNLFVILATQEIRSSAIFEIQR